jgi:hypothetical protein
MEGIKVAERVLEARYRIRDREVAAKRFDDEVIIINLSKGMYYVAEGTGAWIWSAMADGHAPGRVVDFLAKAVDMDAATLSRDIRPFIDSLVDEGLIEPAPGATGGAAEPSGAITAAPHIYAPPLLESYGDMTELLALDPPMPEAATGNPEG